ncbi:ankyrin repeat domain-containing protein [bacterium]|nr:ankyrin repeat domain-containing protein [bacterium]MDA7679847.1 ankyrin repeat domain-containing protein [bacterium]MDC0276900.1 ankyrin repeat domain-containing protein [bacterium]MDC0319353.1 ankyrin repeat domain-containing protein [Verrucomicrobiota bacterium]
MKSILVSIVAAVVLVGCGESQQSAPAPEAKPAEPVAEAAKPEPPTAKASGIPVLSYMYHFYTSAFKELLKPSKPSTAEVLGISIHDATRTGDIEVVKQHIAAGTDVNAKTALDKWTPLLLAAWYGHKEIADLFIANGADVNANGADGRTPLDWAIKYKRTETADLLRKHGGKTGEELKTEGK